MIDPSDGAAPLGIRHASLASIASDWIAQRIVDGTIAPGEKITEDGLAIQMGISRSPVRAALYELSRDGLVVIKPRRGARVSELDSKQAADLYTCRVLIEPLCVRVAVESMGSEDTARLASLFDTMSETAAAKDATSYVTALKDYNLAMFSACPNRILFGLAESSWRGSLRYWNLLVRGHDGYIQQSLRGNAAVHVAAMKGQAVRAERVAAEVLRHSGAELSRLLGKLARRT